MLVARRELAAFARSVSPESAAIAEHKAQLARAESRVQDTQAEITKKQEELATLQQLVLESAHALSMWEEAAAADCERRQASVLVQKCVVSRPIMPASGTCVILSRGRSGAGRTRHCV